MLLIFYGRLFPLFFNFYFSFSNHFFYFHPLSISKFAICYVFAVYLNFINKFHMLIVSDEKVYRFNLTLWSGLLMHSATMILKWDFFVILDTEKERKKQKNIWISEKYFIQSRFIYVLYNICIFLKKNLKKNIFKNVFCSFFWPYKML